MRLDTSEDLKSKNASQVAESFNATIYETWGEASAEPDASAHFGHPTKVTYPDGGSREFQYDERGLVRGVTQPSGAIWHRDSASGVWTSNDGNAFNGAISVDANGQYAYCRADGKCAIYESDGTVRHKLTPEEFSEALKSLEKRLQPRAGTMDISQKQLDAALQAAAKNGWSAKEMMAANVLLNEYWTVRDVSQFDGAIIPLMLDRGGITEHDLHEIEQVADIERTQGFHKALDHDAYSRTAGGIGMMSLYTASGFAAGVAEVAMARGSSAAWGGVLGTSGYCKMIGAPLLFGLYAAVSLSTMHSGPNGIKKIWQNLETKDDTTLKYKWW